MRSRIKSCESFSLEDEGRKLEKEIEEEHEIHPSVIYFTDSSSIISYDKFSDFSICYSWDRQLEEPSNKEILPNVELKEES